MQTSIYYTEEDGHLINTIKEKARKERKSKSAVILSILEEYFRKKRFGEILLEIGRINNERLNKGLEIQQKEEKNKLLGTILLDESFINKEDLDRVLFLQGNVNYRKQEMGN